MSKAYSNKALPAGTVLREWRLEQVLGVGGFGIVYKGRGIYFDELVAIKEYFPSSISERDEDATVVPIDSDAEEVHALGLKKFVEEAKLLWNLSTPTRHPNIVSVRSLFEIHGTAYMVMDFEDGMSLSKMIKSGTKWNEASLTKLIRPIAEGLDRAHRVGVLHRDIKPPNILVNEDGRSVLIDFGSARFESGEATSTKVTFHTPPYAAIEQYVKTYDQGPWTDIYALGVVLYECITGEKPPEVLERMHGGLGKPLAHGDWPGYSKKFLQAVDAAMTIKPTERPQSIAKWLELFDAAEALEASAAADDDFDDDDATKVAAFIPEEIVPVAPPPPGFTKSDNLETKVPSDPGEASFKRAGEDTSATRRKEEAKAAPAPVAKEEIKEPPKEEPKAKAEAPKEEPKPEAKKEEPAKDAKAAVVEPAKDGAAPPKKPGDAEPAKGKDAGKEKPGAAKPEKKMNPALIGGAAAALAILAAGGWYLSSGSSDEPTEEVVVEEVAPVDIEAAGGISAAVAALAEDAKGAGVPAAALKQITDASTALAKQDEELKAMAANPAQADAAETRKTEMSAFAQKAAVDFAALIIRDADGRARRLAAELPWADPRNAGAAAGAPVAQQNAARDVRVALGAIRAASTSAAGAQDPAAALTEARNAMARNAAYNAAIARARRASAEPTATESTLPTTAQPTAAASAAPTLAPDTGQKGKASELFPAKFRRFNSIVSSARDTADDVVRLGRGNEPDSSASQDVKDAYRIRQANVQTARNYLSYLDTLTNSMRGDRTEREVDENIANAEETRRYLQQLKASSEAARR